MIYYTSDLHFGHKNILEYEKRPFSDLKDMEEQLISRWNSVVNNNDEVYVLGDFAFKGSKLSIDDINRIVESLNGKKHLIIGNHDTYLDNIHFNEKLWEEIVPYKQIKDSYYDKDGNKITKLICLMHYPIENWNMQMYGSIHLHGHLHSKPTKLNQENRYNVGCDLWDYYPITLYDIIKPFGGENND